MIRLLSQEFEGKWTEFIKKNQLPYFYSIDYRNLIIESFNHEPYYIISVDNENKLNGIFPSFIIETPFNKKLISMPYCPYGDIAANSENIKTEIEKEIVLFANNIKAKFIEIRSINNKINGFQENKSFYTFHLHIQENFEKLKSSFSKSTRRKLNKTAKISNVNIVFNQDINIFFKFYKKHMKKLGTPHLGIRFFYSLKKHLKFEIASIYFNNEMVSTALLLYDGITVIYDRGASTDNHKNLNLNYLLFWEIIKRYNQKGYKTLDFGKSIRDSGTFQFKNSWRPTVIQLHHQYRYLNGKRMDFSQSNHKRKLASFIFRIFPIPSNLQHLIRKYFP